ncbi:MAG: hypothetical protein Q9187_001961 [Circinaria calcarea]
MTDRDKRRMLIRQYTYSDSFSKREKASEDLFVRQKEREKLLAVKAKIAEQQKHLKELDKHISELTKEQGGEQN